MGHSYKPLFRILLTSRLTQPLYLICGTECLPGRVASHRFLDGSLLVASWNGRFSSWVYTRMFRSRAISSKIIYEKFLRSSNFRSSTDEIMNWNSKHSKHLSFTKEAIASGSWPIFLFISYLQQYKTRCSFE